MDASSPRFKSVAVTAGLSFWFFIITSSVGIFSIELFIAFVAPILIVTHIFAIINTKIFLGILFGAVISIYGILFRLLRIDLLRLKKQSNSYWLDTEQTNPNRIRKQY